MSQRFFTAIILARNTIKFIPSQIFYATTQKIPKLLGRFLLKNLPIHFSLLTGIFSLLQRARSSPRPGHRRRESRANARGLAPSHQPALSWVSLWGDDTADRPPNLI